MVKDRETMETVTEFIFWWGPKSLQMMIAAMKLKDAYPWKKSYDNLDHILKSRDITLLAKIHLVKEEERDH